LFHPRTLRHGAPHPAHVCRVLAVLANVPHVRLPLRISIVFIFFILSICVAPSIIIILFKVSSKKFQ
jgi:hypothetical protein